MNNMISYVILTRNRASYLEDNLKNLIEFFPQSEIIVFNNASEDNTSEILEKYKERVIIINSDKNIGIAGRNQGIKKAKGDIIVTLDDDSLITDKEFEKKVIECFAEDELLAAAGFRIFDEAGNEEKWHIWGDKKDKSGILTKSFVTCGAAFRKEIFDIVGYFDERFFIYVEEQDLATRIMGTVPKKKGTVPKKNGDGSYFQGKKWGRFLFSGKKRGRFLFFKENNTKTSSERYKIKYFPHIKIIHRRAKVAHRDKKIIYFLCRNTLWYIYKNFQGFEKYKKTFFCIIRFFLLALKERQLKYYFKGLKDVF